MKKSADAGMEKRNVIEDKRTPDFQKQAGADDSEHQYVLAFANLAPIRTAEFVVPKDETRKAE